MLCQKQDSSLKNRELQDIFEHIFKILNIDFLGSSNSSEDLIAGFVASCVYPQDECSAAVRTQFGQVYGAFVNWYTANIGEEKYCPTKKKFSSLMEKRFERRKVGQHIWFTVCRSCPNTTRWKESEHDERCPMMIEKQSIDPIRTDEERLLDRIE